jgi:hypothetical protein
VNRYLIFVLATLWSGSALGSPAAAQVALVVGSVRDQHGVAIEGASVVANGPASGANALTDAAGTFSIQASAVKSVTIACRFCATRTLPVREGSPVLAIVRRYDALLDTTPSTADLAALPYAHVESSLGLRPFALLSQTTGILPGSQISDRGLSPDGSLLVDDRVANYDVVAGNSPFQTIPANYEQSASLTTAADAFIYGDQAGGGIATLSPFSNGNAAQIATLGGDTIFRAQAGTGDSAVAAGTYSNSAESRQRADAVLTVPIDSAQTLTLSGLTSQGRDYSSPTSSLADSFSAFDATFEDRQNVDVVASFFADRSTYDALYGALPVDTAWSDSGFSAGVRSQGKVHAFADLATRFSTGFYDAQSAGFPRIANTLTQTHADAGFDFDSPSVDVTAGVGAFWFAYTGGAFVESSASAGSQLATPSLQVTLFPENRWSVELAGSGSFELPTFLGQYNYEAQNSYDINFTRGSLYSGELNYTDGGRLKFSFEDASQSVRGAAVGQITSAGFAATWQVAPDFSLRAWTMHVTDTASANPTGLPYGGVAPTLNATWLTYDNGVLRADAIYRRDLLDNQPYWHLDGDISGPVSNKLRWYVGTEDRLRIRYLDAGLRFNP